MLHYTTAAAAKLVLYE